VIDLKTKFRIIDYHQRGMSIRAIHRETGFHRETIRKYVKAYEEARQALESSDTPDEQRVITERMMEAPRYDTRSRKPRKLTEAIRRRVDEYLAENAMKRKNGMRKQQLTAKDIHEELMAAGADISYKQIQRYVQGKKEEERHREVFIKRRHEPGETMEYDFGDVTLEIAGIPGVHRLAVSTLPATDTTVGHVYKRADMASFLESHNRFFASIGGIPRTMVYDNMKNVVKRFVGRNERELTEDITKLSLYYGFSVRLTNPASPHEKGSVEKSVEVVRRKVFGKRYRFASLEEANRHLEKTLKRWRDEEVFAEERAHLSPCPPPYDSASIRRLKVNSYSFVQIDKNHYSVPEHLVGKTLKVRVYVEHVDIYAKGVRVATHKRRNGSDQYALDVMHYLNTLYKKPGALADAEAFKQAGPLVTSVFHDHYSTDPKGFVNILRIMAEAGMDATINALAELQGHGLKAPTAEQVRRHLFPPGSDKPEAVALSTFDYKANLDTYATLLRDARHE